MKFVLCFTLICMVCKTSADPRSDVDTGFELSNIISHLKDGANMHSALRIVKTFKAASSFFKTMIQTSPLVKELLNTIGSNNAQMRVLLKVTEGQIPNLKDLFELVTTKSGNLADVAHAAVANNMQWQQLSALMRKADFATSKSDIEDCIYIITGRHIDLQSSMTQNPRTGKFQVTAKPGDKYSNLIELMLSLQENWNKVVNGYNLLVDAGDYLGTLQYIMNIDFTHFDRIAAPPAGIGGSKYSVSGAGVVKTDPDVVQLTQLLKSGKTILRQHDANKAEELEEEFTSKFTAIIAKVMKQALSTDEDKPGVVG